MLSACRAKVFLACFALAVPVGSTIGAQDAGVRTLRGVVFDSLSLKPLPGATVWLVSENRAAMSDSVGAFRFSNVSSGAHRVRLETEWLDSLGLAGREDSIAAWDGERRVTLTTPSRSAYWRAYCGGRVPADTGFLTGIVSDARGQRAVRAAQVRVIWPKAALARSGTVAVHYEGGGVLADSAGRFVVCGIPLRQRVTVSVSDSASAPVRFDVTLPPHGVSRRDVYLRAITDASMTGLLTGVIRNPAGGPVANARVAAEVGDTVITRADGRFVLTSLPVGSIRLDVRAIGFAPYDGVVQVQPTDSSRVLVDLSSVTMLDSVLVTARSVPERFVAALEERKALGLGKFVDSISFVRRGSVTNAILSLTSCKSPIVMIDDREIPGEEVARELRLLNPFTIGTLEIYDHEALIPMELAMRTRRRPHCLIILWTKRKFP